MTRVLISFALLFALCAPVVAAESETTLDGTYWKVRDNSFLEKILFWRLDHVSFRDGMFRAQHWEAKGFAAAAYAATKSAESSIAWTATLISAEKGKVVWEGRRMGKTMEGTWAWRKPDGSTKTMSWSARQSLRDYVRAK